MKRLAWLFLLAVAVLGLACRSDTTDPEIQAYADQAYSLSQSYADSLGDLSDLMDQASTNPILVANQEWRIKVAVCMAVWNVNGEKVRSLVPPPELREAHDHFVEATQHLDRAGTLMGEGLDNVDGDKLRQATRAMLQGRDAMNKAAEELDNVVK